MASKIVQKKSRDSFSTENGKCACMLSKGTFGGGGLGIKRWMGEKSKIF